MLDLSTPVAFVMEAAEAVHLIVPRASLPASVAPVQPIHGRILTQGTAMGVFVRRVVEALAAAARHFGSNEVIAVGASIPDLLASCLGPSDVLSATERKDNLGRRLRRFIEENLHRKDLTPSRLTRELGISRSQLFRQFETMGVEAYIRQRRLRRSLLALCDPRHAHRRIGDIAYDMGFADEAHFSRMFRQAFGLSPRAAREAARQADSSAADGMFRPFTAGNSFSDWVMELRAG
ncbi:helix-turn-helix domain-containing protein [Bradyrhizobium sp. USDA 10063]